MRVLMIEDDEQLCDAVRAALEQAGIAVDLCHDGDDGLALLRQEVCDVCVLDRMLPSMDGLTVLRRARAMGVSTPVLLLTALGGVGDRVDGLEAGADDYLTKPFDMRELLARLRALQRRGGTTLQDDAVVWGNARLEVSEQMLIGPKGSVTLSKKECELLEVLMRSAQKLMGRSVLLGRVWGADASVEDANLDSYIHFVRRRLQAVGADSKVVTVRGTGYRLE